MACVRDCLLCSSTCREEGDETLYASNNDVADFIAKIAYRGRQALALLVESSDYALRFNRNVAEFSVEVGELKKAGLTTNGLRGMLCAALIEQIPPPNVQSGSNGNGRWRPPATISDTASFVLTPAGLALLRHTLNEIPILAEPLPLLAVPADGHEASTNGPRYIHEWTCRASNCPKLECRSAGVAHRPNLDQTIQGSGLKSSADSERIRGRTLAAASRRSAFGYAGN